MRHAWHEQLAGEMVADVGLPPDAQVRSALMEERERLFAVLQQFDFLEPYPSQANFILCSVRATAILDGLPDSESQCSNL
jgi:histidinol-phosphate aminotransferase